MVKIFDVIIIGAGPSGILSAITAAKRGRSVLLIEKNEKIGKKILATGNGRCNLTNSKIETSRYHGTENRFIESVLAKFTAPQTIEYFESIGVVLKEEDRGRIFPRTNQAATVVDALLHELESSNVTIKTSSEVKNIDKNSNWTVTTSNSEVFHSKKLILTTGGKAAHQFGSSGDGLYFAQKLGHKLTPIYAALCPIEISETWVKELQGIKIDSIIRSYSGDRMFLETKGDAIFTHFGISGPAAMAQSRVLAPMIDNGNTYLEVDLYPELGEKELDSKLESLFRINSKKSVKNVLCGVLTSGLVPVILKISEVDPNKKSAEISKSTRSTIIANIKALKLTVKSIRPLKEAQVTSGGINVEMISPDTLESLVVPSLYFAGEILDVDGDSGGFNLQWAWSSGKVAGDNV